MTYLTCAGTQPHCTQKAFPANAFAKETTGTIISGEATDCTYPDDSHRPHISIVKSGPINIDTHKPVRPLVMLGAPAPHADGQNRAGPINIDFRTVIGKTTTRSMSRVPGDAQPPYVFIQSEYCQMPMGGTRPILTQQIVRIPYPTGSDPQITIETKRFMKPTP